MNKRAVALGTFDGIHTGHKQILKSMLAAAENKGLEPLIYTFENHPMELFGKAPRRLMEDQTRIAGLEEYAPVLAERFGAELASTEPDVFIRRMAEELGMAVAVAGFNYTFGKMGAGNMDTLRQLGNRYGFEVCEILPHVYLDEPVSSTRIRKCLEEGKLDDANAMLGREYSLSGKVIANRGIGSKIGFPTANIPVNEELALPASGVYAARAMVRGKLYGAVTNIGSNPTVRGERTTIETYILDFDGQIYGEELKICFVERLRGEIVFPSLAELACQIGRDREKAAQILRK